MNEKPSQPRWLFFGLAVQLKVHLLLFVLQLNCRTLRSHHIELRSYGHHPFLLLELEHSPVADCTEIVYALFVDIPPSVAPQRM